MAATELYTRCFALREVVFRITSSHVDYLHPLPPDLLGDEMDTPSCNSVHGKIYIIDIPWEPAAAASPDVLFLAGRFLPDNRRMAIQIGIQVISKFMIRCMENFGVFHVHASAVYEPRSLSLLLLLGSPRSGKSLMTLLVSQAVNIQLVCNSYLAFSSEPHGHRFFRGPSFWLFRPEVVEAVPSFFYGRGPGIYIPIVPIPGFLDSETQIAYDISDRLLPTITVKPARVYLVWPEIGETQHSDIEELSSDRAASLLSQDMKKILAPPTKIPGGVPPPEWDPSVNPLRDIAYRELVESAVIRIRIKGSPRSITSCLLKFLNWA